MFWSLLSLLTVALMIFTMRPVPGAPRRPSTRASDRSGPPTTRRSTDKRSAPEGKVSYRLMDERLPSRRQRMWRSLMRFFKGPPRMEFRGQRDASQGKPGGATGISSESNPATLGRTTSGPQQSVELQSFLDARRRDLTKRNADETKRGPDDTLH
ncbi:MAG: hypothetical protein K2Y05_08925 [Hyphomicrobiaceae bacterium]|nr:hypothetical protein [Hyphomicrobiaceae bacterium]